MSSKRLRIRFLISAGILVAAALSPFIYQGMKPSLRTQAERGDAEAQFHYAYELLNPGGVSERFNDAGMQWLRKSAEQGYAVAQYSLAEAYLQGFKNKGEHAAVESARWFRMAAEQGHFYAQYRYSQACATGQGVPQDMIEAYAWASLAAASGVSDCVQAHDELARRLTPEQIAEGKRRAAAYVAKK
jgi:hypothetical protein